MNKTASLTPKARRIIEDKATEYPYSGIYNKQATFGSYLCRRCGLALFRASSQFDSGCGWPSFDTAILDTVEEHLDADGIRSEIICSRCQAHLGHVFYGEHFTAKNCRYCVNALSLDFVKNKEVLDSEEAIVAGGCFWGIDWLFQQFPGVLKTEAGYTGGFVLEPTYEEVCQGNTGHFEAVRIVYDPTKTDYEMIIKYFFEIHDPSQQNGQGPDLGPQYQSALFYYDEAQLAIGQQLIQTLKALHYPVSTQCLPVQPFWPAEEFHQDYYLNNGKKPYCHRYVQRFK